jgi:xanthine dehydrogenase YagT iron-sulfur-binding subunit
MHDLKFKVLLINSHDGVASCLTRATQADGRHFTTIEGLAPASGKLHPKLHPMRQVFIDYDVLQRGRCTPGQIMAAGTSSKRGRPPQANHTTLREHIREYPSGNLCRRGAYVGIVAAVGDASPTMRGT